MQLPHFVASMRCLDPQPISAWWRRGLVVTAGTTLLVSSLVGATAFTKLKRAPGLASAAVVEPLLPGIAAPAAPPAPAPAPVLAVAPDPVPGPGYRIAARNGGVFTHGAMGFAGSAAGASPSPTVAVAHTPDGGGYWTATADGGVFAFGHAGFFGSAAEASIRPVVGMAATASGLGYWLVASDGGVFAFGDAPYAGSGPEAGLTARIVAMAPTSTGQGYWLAAADGGVFTFGDAAFHGSLGDARLNSPVADLVPTPTGQGYYLVGTDGGVFTFGDATFAGAALEAPLSGPVVDMALAPDGSGYWLLTRDGGVFSFGDAPFLGAPAESHGGIPFASIAAGLSTPEATPPPPPAAEAPAEMAAASSSQAPVELTPAPTAAAPLAAAAKSKTKGAKGAKSAEGRALDGEFGWDISYPQCDRPLPEGRSTYVVVGVTGGRSFRYNRCLAEQWRWARQRGAAGIYLNVNYPHTADERSRGATSDRQPNCAPGAEACVAYNFGLNNVRDALAYAASNEVSAPFAWLDVEQLNYWNPDRSLNAVVLRGAIDGVREAGLEVGIYSTPYQYTKIMGGEAPQVPVWTAGAPDLGAVGRYCAEKGFGGGPAVIVQLRPERFDPNVACPGAGPLSHYFAT